MDRAALMLVERAVRYTERWNESQLVWGLAVFVAGFWLTFAVACYWWFA